MRKNVEAFFVFFVFVFSVLKNMISDLMLVLAIKKNI